MAPNGSAQHHDITLSFQLLLMNILNCVYESVNLILRRNIEKKNIFDKMDSVFLAIDEICDSG